MMRTISDIEEVALTAVRRAIAAATKAERKRCLDLTRDAARERRDLGDPEGSDAIWDLAQRIGAP